MARRTQVPYDDRTLDGVSMEFDTVREHWNEYRLEDGSTVRVKLVPAEIVKTAETNAVGDPLVVVLASIIVQYRKAEPSTGEGSSEP